MVEVIQPVARRVTWLGTTKALKSLFTRWVLARRLVTEYCVLLFTSMTGLLCQIDSWVVPSL